ncbi:MAG: hypothetical protein GC202_13260 [Alphaproteobacteria bacterium]|nr:hypothetical protein [Alphaproteobacteria bacterium]
MTYTPPTIQVAGLDGAEAIENQASARPHNVAAAVLCIFMICAVLGTATWIHDRERSFGEAFAEFRAAAIERSLLSGDTFLAQLVARADLLMVPVMRVLDGHAPVDVPPERLATALRVPPEHAADGVTIDVWRADGRHALDPSRGHADGEEFFRHHVGDGRYAASRALVADPFRDVVLSTGSLGGRRTLVVSRTVSTPEGEALAVVAVSIPTNVVTDYLMTLRQRASDRVAIYRNDGQPVAQYPAESAAGIVDIPATDLWRRYPASSFGRIHQKLAGSGTEAVTVFLGLQPLPLVLVYTAEYRPIAQEALRIYWPVLAIAIITLVVAIGYAWSSTRYANALARANVELAGAKARLQFESDERGIFIANMNHELRTPLNAIVGFAQILADATFGPSHPKYREYARDIATSGEHLRNLIGEIIDFSAIDQGRRRVDVIQLDAMQSVRDVVRHLKPVAVNRSITLVVTGEEAVARGDAVALRQVLINLLTNAIKFSLPGGTVEIRTCVTLRGDSVEIAVIDRGAGIDPDELESVGRPFFRARAARLGAVSGTGLGLSVAVALAHQMGGRLLLESAPGAGTTVTLQLPAAQS